MLALWLASVRVRDASIVDLFWGTGLALLATWLAVAQGHREFRSLLITGLVLLWGLRLTGHLAWRGRGRGEDLRYRVLRARYGASFWWKSGLLVFGFQGAAMWVVSLPLQQALSGPAVEMSSVHWFGVAVAAVGLGLEASADLQLTRFRAEPGNRRQVCTRGLWRYSRHPNYFGDCLFWWGLFALSYAGPQSWWTTAGPVAMTTLLLSVSGIPPLERDIAKRRPGYTAYRQRTSCFIPLPPRAGKGFTP